MTKEDLMQISGLLNAMEQRINDRMDTQFNVMEQRINDRMDTQFNAMEQRINDRMDTRFNAMEQRIDDRMDAKLGSFNAVLESQIQPQLNLLAEEIQSIKENMATNERVDELEERMDSRFDILETAVKYHGTEIARLKKAQ